MAAKMPSTFDPVLAVDGGQGNGHDECQQHDDDGRLAQWGNICSFGDEIELMKNNSKPLEVKFAGRPVGGHPWPSRQTGPWILDNHSQSVAFGVALKTPFEFCPYPRHFGPLCLDARFHVTAQAREQVDDVEDDVGQLRDDAQIVDEEEAVLGIGFAGGRLEFVVGEVTVGAEESQHPHSQDDYNYGNCRNDNNEISIMKQFFICICFNYIYYHIIIDYHIFNTFHIFKNMNFLGWPLIT
jgi:hypothetical protein